MESTWAIAIWKLYVSKNKFRYTQMISDGDSKTSKLALWCVQPGKQARMSGACGRKNGNGTKRECKGEVCEWEGRVCEGEDEGEGAVHRQVDKTVDSLLWQIHQIQHRWLCGNPGWSGLCFTTPSPQTAVHSTSIAPVTSSLDATSTGHLPIPSIPHLTHPPSIQTLFSSQKVICDSLTLHWWSVVYLVRLRIRTSHSIAQSGALSAAITGKIAVNLIVISFNSVQVLFTKLQERLEVTVSPLTRHYLSDKDNHRVSASVMKAEVQVMRWRKDLHLD